MPARPDLVNARDGGPAVRHGVTDLEILQFGVTAEAPL